MQIFRKIGLLAFLMSAIFITGISAQTLGGRPIARQPVIPADTKEEVKTGKDVPSDSSTDGQTVEPFVYATILRPTVVGVCDTAGPIEVESSGGTAAGVPTAYATLGAAFTAINGGTAHLGVITIDVCGDTTEVATAALNEVAGVTSVTIAPAGGAARTISGAIAGEGMILLNGADNVTFDGLNTGGNALTISNTSNAATTATSTIRFIGGATNNTVTRSTVLGSFSGSLATNGGNIFFSTDAVTVNGNDNNTISSCNIGPAGANLPTKLIYGNGSTTTQAIENSGIIINNNNLFDFFSATLSVSGVYVLSGNDNWTISNNRIYQTAARTFTGTVLRYGGITLSSTTGTLGAFTVTGNTIGFGAANGTGTTTISGSTNTFRGIDAPSVNATTPTSIQGNTISGINQTTASTATGTTAGFIGMILGSTGGRFNVGNTTGNNIGSLNGASTIVLNTTASGGNLVGIYDFSISSNIISNNNMGAITIQGTGTTNGFRGILVNTGTTNTVTLANNTIGGTNAAGAITDALVGANSLYGIQVSLPSATITGNTIRNMIGNSTTANGIVSSGIIITTTSTGVNTISQNTIHSLSNSSGAASNSIYALYTSFGTAANVVSRNFVHSLSITSTALTSQLAGILPVAGTGTYQNNMVRLGIDAGGNSITAGYTIYGIFEIAGTNNIYNNSVYIGGTGVTTSTSNTFAFVSNVVTNTRNYLDNIFYNARSNATAGGAAHVAVLYGGTTPNPAGLTSNYNDLYAPGTDGVLGVFNGVLYTTLPAFRTATGQEANSFSADPQFINPTGTATTVDLHISPTNPTPIEGSGIAIAAVTDDFDGQIRANFTPTDIGADAGNFVVLDISAPAISYTALGNTASTTSRTITVTITDQTGIASGANAPRIYFKKSTDAGYVSTQCVMTGGTTTNATYTCTIDYSLVGGGSVAVGDTIQYFVVAQDTLGNLGSNPGGATGANVNTVTFSGTPNSYTILPSIGGNKTVGAGGDYATLTAAFAAINGAVITAPVTLTLTDASYTTPAETFPLTLNANGGSSAANSVTIKPMTGVTPTISGVSASCAINLNGADYVTIDGSNTANGTTRDLTVANTGTGTSSAVICLTSTAVNAGATNNTIKNTNVVGTTVTATPATVAGIFSGSSTISVSSAGADNDNNTIQNNNITKTVYGIYSGGASAANQNTGTVITQNVMNAASPNNITTGGIVVNFEDGVSITQNDISVLKNDGTIGTTGTAFGIALGIIPSNTVTVFTGSNVTNGQVRRNRVNGVTQLNTTGYSGFGIVVNSVTAGTTLVSNNMISGIRTASTASDFSGGIIAGGGTGSTTQIYYNSVAMTGTRGAATFPSYGLAIGSGDPVVDVRNNIFYNTQTSTSTSKQYAVGYASTTFVNLTSNTNDYYVTGANGFVGQTGGLGTAGTDRLDLAALQAATGKDANSISVDPLFVDPTSDLHITPASPVQGLATPLAAITIDFDGQTRDPFPDIGADEIVTFVAPTVQFNSPTYTVAEGAAATITVTRTGDTTVASSVMYATSNGSATGGAACTAGVDYITASGTLNFAAGSVSQTFTVTTCSDAIFKGGETVNLTLSNPTLATLGAQSTAVLTITNVSPGTLTLSSGTYTFGEAVGTATIPVNRTSGTNGAVSVAYTLTNGTAIGGAACTAGVDYINTGGTVNFADGASTANITVPICNDTLNETNETFNVILGAAGGGATVGSPSTAVVTITDDDAAPSLSINDVSQAEGNAGTTAFTFTVTLSAASGQTVTLNYATANGTATAGSDYTATSGTLTFAPGDLTKTITVLVNGDTLNEPDETFFVNLTAPTNATISDNQGLGTIVNDDVAPNLSINDVSLNEGNSGTTAFNFTVTLSAASGQTVTVAYATADGTATQPSDYASTSGTLTFAPGDLTKTVTVNVVGDTLNEPDETFFVNLTAPTNATISDNQGLGTILNDDGAPSLSINDVSMNEGNSGTTAFNFTVTLSGVSGQPVTVAYATANGTATAPSDYASTSGTLTFAPGVTTQTVTVNVNGDTQFEPNETFFVNLTTPTNATISDNQGLGTILNDDANPLAANISDARVVEGDSGTTTATFTVTLTNAPPFAGDGLTPEGFPPGTVTIAYATANGTATAGQDYVANSGTLVFLPGETSKTITVTVNGDTQIESNEFFYVNLSSPNGATISDGQGVGIIVDDDRAYTSDFDNDRITDFSVFRPSNGVWYTLQSTNNVPRATTFGLNGDIPVPGDYDADGIVDIAVFRPSTGIWYVKLTGNAGELTQPWGIAGDIPVQGDYDKDGKTDFAVFRPSNGVWYYIRSSDGVQRGIAFGTNGDIPVQGDYDGDAQTDLAVFRNGVWYTLRSRDGSITGVQFGLSSDKAVVGDFDGDGRADYTVYRGGTWYVQQSLTNTIRAVSFGLSSDIPVAADYDGDGTSDIAVFRPSNGTWYGLRSSTGAFFGFQWGSNGDIPIPSRYTPSLP